MIKKIFFHQQNPDTLLSQSLSQTDGAKVIILHLEPAVKNDFLFCKHFYQTANNIRSTLKKISLPTIAAVDGPLWPDGLELALMCDFFLISAESTFHQGRSLTPGFGSTRLLSYKLNNREARNLMMHTMPCDAPGLLDRGLASHMVTSKQFTAELQTLAEALGNCRADNALLRRNYAP